MNRTWRQVFALLTLILTVQCLCMNPSDVTSIIATETPPAIPTVDISILTPQVLPPADTVVPEPLPTAIPTQALPPLETRVYDAIQTVTMRNNGPGSVRVVFNLALVQDVPPYQQVLTSDISPAGYQTQGDEHGNKYAVFEIAELEAGSAQVFTNSVRVAVNAVRYGLEGCGGDMPAEYTAPEQFIDSDAPQVVELAAKLGDGKATVCNKARSYYEYIGDTLTYAGYVPDEMGALATINAGSGDCTDFADVMISLSRAAGIPARFMEGVTCCTDKGYVEGQIKHDWTEVFLPPAGWVPVDPTYGQPPGNEDSYFAAVPADRIIVTRGQNLQVLSGYHYWSYTYWYDNTEPDIETSGEWSILKVQ